MSKKIKKLYILLFVFIFCSPLFSEEQKELKEKHPNWTKEQIEKEARKAFLKKTITQKNSSWRQVYEDPKIINVAISESNDHIYSKKEFQLGQILRPILHKTNMDLKHINLEESRRNEFQHLPSRMNRCTFIAPTIKSANEWARDINISKWRNNNIRVKYFVYKVTFRDHPIWFNAHYFNIAQRTNDYNNYWKSATPKRPKGDDSYEAFMNCPVKIVQKLNFEIIPGVVGNIRKIKKSNSTKQ